jgi:hypothetical protein
MQQQQFLSQSAVGFIIDPARPLSVDALRAWHDRVSGSRDSAGRRIWGQEVVERVRETRAKRGQKVTA